MQFTSLYSVSLVLGLVSAAPKPSQIEFSVTKSGHSIFSDVNSNAEACLLVCFQEEVQCQPPSFSKQFGDCWTCCTKFGEDEDMIKALEAPMSTDLIPITPSYKNHKSDVCWAACFFEEPDCPDRLYSKQFGECWTCCVPASDSTALHGGHNLFKSISDKTSDITITINVEDKSL